VPEDVAVTGCDGTEISLIFDPSVTTMRLPYDDMSIEAVRILINKIDHPNSKNIQAVFNTTLSVRKSTKRDAAVLLEI
jgi:DNA-binding LacI/PurR family transcriptional regulator